jgi:hypothetical protein
VALQVLEFEFKSAATQEIAKEWSHLGVTGSGDLEVLMEKKALNGGVKEQHPISSILRYPRRCVNIPFIALRFLSGTFLVKVNRYLLGIID